MALPRQSPRQSLQTGSPCPSGATLTDNHKAWLKYARPHTVSGSRPKGSTKFSRPDYFVGCNSSAARTSIFGNTTSTPPITNCSMPSSWPWPSRKVKYNPGNTEPRQSPKILTPRPVNEAVSNSLRPSTTAGCSRAELSSKSMARSRPSQLESNQTGSNFSTSKRARSNDNIQTPTMKSRPNTTTGCSRYPPKMPRQTAASSRDSMAHSETTEQGNSSTGKITMNLNTGRLLERNLQNLDVDSIDDFVGLAPTNRPSVFPLAGTTAASALTHALQSVKSYSSPPFNGEGLADVETRGTSISGAAYKSPSTKSVNSDIPKGVLRQKKQQSHEDLTLRPGNSIMVDSERNAELPSKARPNLEDSNRNPSISSDFKVGPLESLVTVMPSPSTPQEESIDASISPSAEGRLRRKRNEAALRMYPRNLWGPVHESKWGYQEDIIPGSQTEKCHFLNDKDKLEKQRLEARTFGHQRHWVRFKNVLNYWEGHEARESDAFIDEKERFLTDSEQMLHTQNDKRKARAKNIEDGKRIKKEWKEYERLKARELEHITKVDQERYARESPGVKANNSGVIYNIVTLAYPNTYAGDLLRYEDNQAELLRWRKCMRALRLQSRQSGARLYNVVSWKPKKPCCVPPPRPMPPIPPDTTLDPSPRKPDYPHPRNILHLDDTCVDVPIGCTNDLRTNW